MKLDEVTPVLDVHPPHHAPNGVRDFLLHLFTITIGLLIALSLEGLVEWQHHKHLAHNAAASMRSEIAANAKGMPDAIADLKKRQDQATRDVAILEALINDKSPTKGKGLSLGFGIHNFDNVAWKTSQSTNALAYIPYDEAEEFAAIYSQQELLAQTQQSAARDAMVAVGPFITLRDSADPTPAQAEDIVEKIGVLQGQILLVSSVVEELNQQYTEFLKKHPQ